MKILVTGATGMVGSEVVRRAQNDPSVKQITLLVRRPSGFKHPKVTEIIHHDFLEYGSLTDIFMEHDACIWCLGISQSRVSKKEYYRITYDYTIAAASAMNAVNPRMTFIFVSGEGADSTEKSPVRFARVKGMAENGLLKLHLKNLYLFRPGGIVPTTRGKNEGLYKKFEITMVSLMAAVLPWSVVTTKQLSESMLQVAREGYPKTIIRNRDIRNF